MTNGRPKRGPSQWTFLLALLLAVNAWAAWQWRARLSEDQTAQDQLAECLDLATEIKALRMAPVRIDEGVRTTDRLAELVQGAATGVKLPSDKIVRVDPSVPRRVAETAYLEQLTDVELRELQVKELAQFAFAIHESAPSVEVTALTLQIPPGTSNEANSELWNVRMILTSHCYEPNIPVPPRAAP